MTLTDVLKELTDSVNHYRERADKQPTKWMRGYFYGNARGIRNALRKLKPLLKDLDGDPENEYEAS